MMYYRADRPAAVHRRERLRGDDGPRPRPGRTPIARSAPTCPADLEQVVLRCLAKKRDDRYPDVKSLARALAACHSAADWDAENADRWWAENAGSFEIDTKASA